jgi:glycosyltransferase involved in cell wall biosynthesis
MKVLHVNLSPPGKGGIERLLVDFVHRLHSDEFEISLCILGRESETSRELSRHGCKVWCLGRSEDRFDWDLYPRLVRLLSDYRPDVVHIHGNPGLLFAVPAARWVGLQRLVYTCHFSRSGHSWGKHALLGSLLRLVPVRVAVSRAAQRVLAEHYHLPPSMVEVVYNGVDLDRFQPRQHRGSSASAAPVIGFCGVFRPEKQIPLLIEAFARLRGEGRSARLLLVGDGPTMAECSEKVRRYDIEEHVTFAGEQVDVVPFMGQMDIVVLPSREEAMPVALLEAMALGKAVVASDIGGVPEIVEDGVSGLLVRAGDVEQLCSVLGRVLADDGARGRLGEGARRRIEARFSVTRMMGTYAEIYRRIGAARRHTPRIPRSAQPSAEHRVAGKAWGGVRHGLVPWAID